MSSTALIEILEEAPKSLPPDEQRQLREAISKLRETTGDGKPLTVAFYLLAAGLIVFLEKRKALRQDERRRLYDLLDRGAVESGLVGKADLIREIQGKYAHLPTSSEAFAARKAEEIALEDRRSRS